MNYPPGMSNEDLEYFDSPEPEEENEEEYDNAA